MYYLLVREAIWIARRKKSQGNYEEEGERIPYHSLLPELRPDGRFNPVSKTAYEMRKNR